MRAPRPWLLLCCVLVAVIACYLPVLGAPLIWDDHHLIERNPLVQQLRPLADYFGQSFWQGDDLGQGRTYYRPLIILSLAIDHHWFGDSPGGFHATNLLVHLFSTVLLFRLLRVRGASGYAAVLGTAFWALYPRLTEAVAWISGRTDVLAAFFVLAALLARARATLAGRIACALFLLLGLLCKEVALAGVLAVLLFELAGAGSWRARLGRALPSLLSLVCYLLLRAQAVGITSVKPADASGRVQRVLAAIGHYFAMLLTPWFPNLQIGRLDEPSSTYVALGAAVLLALGGWGVHRARTGNWPSVELLGLLTLTAVGFGLVLHIVPFSINVIATDRFLYLPLLGLTLLLTPVVASLPKAPLVAGVCSLLAVSFGAATFARANTWSDEVELWTVTYRDNSESRGLACSELGRLYARAGLFAQAYSIDIQCPSSGLMRLVLINNGASLLARAGRYREAMQLLGGLSPADRRRPIIRLNFALFRTYLNDFEGARAELARALQADPTYADGLALAKRISDLENRRRQADALPEAAAPVERARQLGKLGLAVEALHAWQTAFASPALSRAQFDEGVWFALAEGDAATIDDFHRRYRARFAGNDSPLLQTAYDSHRELVERLLSAWPGLNVPLLRLPG